MRRAPHPIEAGCMLSSLTRERREYVLAGYIHLGSHISSQSSQNPLLLPGLTDEGEGVLELRQVADLETGVAVSTVSLHLDGPFRLGERVPLAVKGHRERAVPGLDANCPEVGSLHVSARTGVKNELPLREELPNALEQSLAQALRCSCRSSAFVICTRSIGQIRPRQGSE